MEHRKRLERDFVLLFRESEAKNDYFLSLEDRHFLALAVLGLMFGVFLALSPSEQIKTEE